MHPLEWGGIFLMTIHQWQVLTSFGSTIFKLFTQVLVYSYMLYIAVSTNDSFCVVTLYELMVVNNWHVIMEGFVSTTSWAARVYFILFWIANIVRI